jgi:S1-C subfamily serine protease
VPYVERDVSRDWLAAEEMLRRSGQMGVPVIAVDGQVVVGFDQPRLEQLLASTAREFRLGAAVAAAKGDGLYVGQVRPGSPADVAGLRPGDVIEAVNGRPPAGVEDFQQRLQALGRLVDTVSLAVSRQGAQLTLTIPMRR